MSTNPLHSISPQILQRHTANEFEPTAAHRQAKSAFWAHYFQEGDLPPVDFGPALATRVSGYSEVSNWWSQKGFPEWFRNGEEFRQKVEHTSQLALDLIHNLIIDPVARTSDRLNAAKMALEIAAKFPRAAPKQETEDDKISKMSRTEIEEYIRSQVSKLPAPAEEQVDNTTNSVVD